MNDTDLLKHVVFKVGYLDGKIAQVNTILGRYEERLRNIEATLDSLKEKLSDFPIDFNLHDK